MPRLSHALILQAYSKSSLLPLVLRGTRTLESGINELRWLREHVLTTAKPGQCPRAKRKRLLQLCLRRSRAEPLQYILGSQPFGDLDIKCRPGVLIPRPETEAYTAYAAKLLNDESDKLMRSTVEFAENEHRLPIIPSLRILDVCSGSGCISLLLHSLLAEKFRDTTIFGLDISEAAVNLAKENLRKNVEAGNLVPQASGQNGGHPQVQFGICNVLSKYPRGFNYFDIIISNPPYISKSKFATETTRSVRNYEPTLALVPSSTKRYKMGHLKCEPEDIFYHRLIKLYYTARCKMLVMEIGDEEQARRVVEMVLSTDGLIDSNTVEIWRDWPDREPEDGEATVMRLGERFTPSGEPDMSAKTREQQAQISRPKKVFVEARGVGDIPIKGAGKIRTVVLFRKKKFDPMRRKPEAVPMTLKDIILSREDEQRWKKDRSYKKSKQPEPEQSKLEQPKPEHKADTSNKTNPVR
ncbi:hypothetical protein EG329_001922 [Mollisiaceae sp. DMI_Dod_QoI]|nr:hypothetical protein EG329_001922 [Helotiales sp. DMI_Dod_QoI]